MITVRVVADPNIAKVLDRGHGRDFVNLLRRSVRQNAIPTLEAARELVPVDTGRLRASLSITGKTTPSQGTVSAVIMPRNEFSFRDKHGTKHLLISARTKAQKIAAAQARGTTIDSAQHNPFLYAYGIETGQNQDGSLARKKGGAKFLEKGTDKGARAFTDGVTRDAMAFITTGM